MLLVPRRLQRHGMTGPVPYYGGRLTPAHIQGLSRPVRPPAPAGGLSAVQSPAPAAPTTVRSPVPGAPAGVRPPAPGAAVTPAGVIAALEYPLSAEVTT